MAKNNISETEFDPWLATPADYRTFLNGGQIDFDRNDGNRTPQVLVEDAAKKGLWVFPLVEGNAPTLVSPRDYQVMDRGAVVTRYGDTDFPDGVLVVYPGPDKAPHSAYVDVSAVRFVPGVEIDA